jgi:hypothetical protein
VGDSHRGPPARIAPIPAAQPFEFVVIGDNRPDSEDQSGEEIQQPPVFIEMLKAIAREHPALVITTGDMIPGYAGEEGALRDQWRSYRDAIGPMAVPYFNVPGNHDIQDETSAKLWKEMWGPTYYAFDYGSARFIALDTETEESRVTGKQFAWLQQQLEGAGSRHVFLFFHRPLFPFGPHIGNSLDKHPEDRDRLHQLFVRNKDRIRGVFQGHEHLYNFTERDGIPYYITGGGGADLYVTPDKGGFHHFLTVSVTPERVSMSVHRFNAPPKPPPHPAALKSLLPPPLALLESWEGDRRFGWVPFGDGVTLKIVEGMATEGRHGARLDFDFSKSEAPVMYAKARNSDWDLSRVGAVLIDVYCPAELSGKNLAIKFNVEANEDDDHAGPPAILQPGEWKTVRSTLDPSWLPMKLRGRDKSIAWGLVSDDKKLAGWVAFDNFRVEGK